MINKLIKLIQYLFEYLRDFVFVIRFNSYSPFEDENRKLYYQIIILSHAVEKGLSLSRPRTLFGQEKIQRLIQMVRHFDPIHSNFPLQMARGALISYVEMHRNLGIESPFLSEVDEFVTDQAIFADVLPSGGVRMISLPSLGEDLQLESKLDFLNSRFSCRAYKPSIVNEQLLEELIATAQSAPSQCNRQSVRVHCYQEKREIEQLLLLQGGSAGFSKLVHNLFIITSEITAWGGLGQRSQGYVDGGLFAMELLLACHAYGLGSCALNLAIGNTLEAKIKKMAGIHSRERLIMMMAFGHPEEIGLKAAMSPRLPLDEVLLKH